MLFILQLSEQTVISLCFSFLLDNPDVNVLFQDNPVSGNCLLSILRTKTNSDSTTDYIERHTYQLFA